MRAEIERETQAFVRSCRWLAEQQDHGVVDERDGVVVSATGLPFRPLNPAFVVSEPLDLEATLRWGLDRRAGLPAPSSGYDLPDGAHPAVEAQLLAMGFEPRVRRPGMQISTAAPLPGSIPPGLSIAPVATAADFADFQRLQEEVFEFAPEVASHMPPYASLGTPSCTVLIGTLDGEAVTTACVTAFGDLGAIYSVATDPAYTRRGYGAAVTAAAVRQAAALGVEHVALQSSPEGLQVYERLGFTSTVDWVVWLHPDVDPPPSADADGSVGSALQRAGMTHSPDADR